MDYLEKLRAVIGPAGGPGVAAANWRELEGELGVTLPEDFKVLTEWYAPIRIGWSIRISNPGTVNYNLGSHIRETVAAYQACSFSLDNFPGFSRTLGFGGPDGLIPVSGTAHGEEVFLFNDHLRGRWQIVVFVGADLEFYQYDMGFAEWLYRYLVGEDMAGPNSAQDFPNPLPLTNLLAPGGTGPVERCGPRRPY
ncbi:SMI1/KNR4 family protein [Kitasatospora sp. NPDC057965]|uniref:SMI1/KNR4 family protein n=1 Tax=Kitasatospora sp. NPDC057965 TaxID=3346291 RepID=UPI0036D942BB